MSEETLSPLRKKRKWVLWWIRIKGSYINPQLPICINVGCRREARAGQEQEESVCFIHVFEIVKEQISCLEDCPVILRRIKEVGAKY